MSAVETPRIRLPYAGELTGARKVLLERAAALGFSFADLSKAISRNKGYIHDYVSQGTPRRLSEDDRTTLAAMLQLSPENLREEADASLVLPPAPDAGAQMSPAAGPYSGRQVPLYDDTDRLDPTQAKKWAPPFNSKEGPAAAAITIYKPICGRLMPGDVCYAKSGVPVRAGDLVVLMTEADSSIAAIGELTAIALETAQISLAGSKKDFTLRGTRLLKIVGTMHP